MTDRYPTEYGVQKKDGTYFFRIYSKIATSIHLQIFHLDEEKPFLEKKMIKEENIWSCEVESLTPPLRYGFWVDQKFLVSDPYAKELDTSMQWGRSYKHGTVPLGIINKEEIFDWQGIKKPRHSLEDLIIYEMHIRNFTKTAQDIAHPGTFLGAVEKIPYLLSLGVTAVELMPIFAFNECEITSSETHPLYNAWGYSPINFFSPMKRFASNNGQSAVLQCKTMIREFHRHGIEVILDVVYNHTAESKSPVPLNFKGLDQPSYYMLDPKGHDMNFSGCGNTFNAQSEPGRRIILDSLRYWAEEMQVDGFRFDLASILTRGSDGTPLQDPPLLNEMASDPILKHTKLIAEPWDPGGLYQLGFFPKWGFLEWNGRYRDVSRKFMKGQEEAGLFSDMLGGSKQIYHLYKSPLYSVNFVTCHDGFTLQDLVSYNMKHNEQNQEKNRDGTDANLSWNMGHEGPSNDSHILSLRNRQKKNFFTALLISRGIPMLFMGDEIGHTKKGNNNTWCQDNELSWISWDDKNRDLNLFAFTQKLIHLRKQEAIFHENHFFDLEVKWHGPHLEDPNWTWDQRFVALTLQKNNLAYYICFNTSLDDISILLPELSGKVWYPKIRTWMDSPADFIDNPRDESFPIQEIELPKLSSLVAIADRPK
jgi:isoamylase